MSTDAADGLERDIATLERALEGLRKEIESEVYGWGDERNRAQQRLDVGTEHLAKMRPPTIAKLDEQLPIEEFGPDAEAGSGPLSDEDPPA